jgi:hypothetical protein
MSCVQCVVDEHRGIINLDKKLSSDRSLSLPIAMSEGKRKSNESDNKRKKRYRSVSSLLDRSCLYLNDFPQDGTPIWEKRRIDGPGVWVTCMSTLRPRIDFHNHHRCQGERKASSWRDMRSV